MTDCPLTTKELACVKWLSEGHTAAEIAEFEQRTLSAIQTRIQLSRDKVGCASAASLVATAIRQGWIR